jgi:hypothetical protein
MARVERLLKEHVNWKRFIDKEIARTAGNGNGLTGSGNYSAEKSAPIAALTLPNDEYPEEDNLAMNTTAKMNLRDRWILDTGASIHVCNNRSLFDQYTVKKAAMRTGDSFTRVEGIGTVRMLCVDPITGGTSVVRLHDVKYSPDFHVNLVSYSQAKTRGCRWDENGGCMRSANGSAFAKLTHDRGAGLWLFDQPAGDATA